MSIQLFRHYIQLPIVLLMLVELGIAIAALYAVHALLSPQGWPAPAADVPLPAYVLFAGVLGLCISAMGLYNPRLREQVTGLALRLILAAACAWVVLSLVAWLVPSSELTARRFAAAVALAAGLDLVLRYVLTRVVGVDVFKRRVLVYGAGRQAASISRLRRRTDQIGFSIVGYLRTQGDSPAVRDDMVLAPSPDLLTLCRELDVDEIIVAMDDRRRGFPVHELLQCRLHGIEVLELLNFLERETGRLRLDVLNPGWLIFASGFSRSRLREAVGRLLDIVASLGLLMVAWPFMLLTVMAIKLEDGLSAPVLYRQARVGLDGRVFDVLKFRSMTLDAEADGVARWAQTNDNRITHVGACIRKARIDELPQLLNVLRGDMRFVGPRPERPEFVEELSERIPYYRERHCVKPGLTGWAQLCYPYGSSERDAAEKLQYDLYYVKNRSLLFDLAILVQTVEVILFGKGAR